MDTETIPPPNSDESSPAPGTAHRTMTQASQWILFGSLATYGSAAIAILATMPLVNASTDDYAFGYYFLTVPLGFIIGVIAAMLIARRAEASSPSAEDLFTRTQLVFAGVVLPPVAAVSGAFVVELILNANPKS